MVVTSEPVLDCLPSGIVPFTPIHWPLGTRTWKHSTCAQTPLVHDGMTSGGTTLPNRRAIFIYLKRKLSHRLR